MTPAQSARTEGFLASLAERGVLFQLPGGSVVEALVEPVSPDQGEFSVGRPTAAAARLHVLRTHAAELAIGIGTVLRDAGDWTYRVTEIDDLPIRVSVVLTCEVAPVP
jgi:hypothetical protein